MLLSSENLHQGKHARKSSKLKEISGYAISVVQKVLDAGKAQNVFRADVKARDRHFVEPWAQLDDRLLGRQSRQLPVPVMGDDGKRR